MPSPAIEGLGLLLHETARVWRTKLDQRLRPLGLSMGKWTTLVHLAKGGDKLTQNEVANRVGVEGPTLAGILDRLEGDGWVKRKASTADRRCKTVHLQQRSVAVLDEIYETARQFRTELFAGIPKSDLETCARVLSQIRDRALHASGEGIRNEAERRNGRQSLRPSSLS